VIFATAPVGAKFPYKICNCVVCACVRVCAVNGWWLGVGCWVGVYGLVSLSLREYTEHILPENTFYIYVCGLVSLHPSSYGTHVSSFSYVCCWLGVYGLVSLSLREYTEHILPENTFYIYVCGLVSLHPSLPPSLPLL